MVYAARGMAADFDASLAGVAELVDALDLGSSDESCGGSSPSARTKFHRFQHPMTFRAAPPWNLSGRALANFSL
jgi:hypothetical protein